MSCESSSLSGDFDVVKWWMDVRIICWKLNEVNKMDDACGGREGAGVAMEGTPIWFSSTGKFPCA